MVLPLGVPLELRAVEVDLPQVAGAVPPGLIVEMRRFRMAALAPGCDCLGAHGLAELDHGDEAIATRAVPHLRARVGTCSERGQRSPLRGGEAHGNAGARVAE